MNFLKIIVISTTAFKGLLYAHSGTQGVRSNSWIDHGIMKHGIWNWNNGCLNFWGLKYGGIVMFILFLLIIVFVVYVLYKTGKVSTFLDNNNESALDIIKRRYANGEITKEEFDRLKNDLR